MAESLIGEAIVGLINALTRKVEPETEHEKWQREFDERSRKFHEDFHKKFNK